MPNCCEDLPTALTGQAAFAVRAVRPVLRPLAERLHAAGVSVLSEDTIQFAGLGLISSSPFNAAGEAFSVCNLPP